MSNVLANNRRVSKFEVLINADKINESLLEFSSRNFGIKDLNSFIRSRYRNQGSSDARNSPDIERFMYLLISYKEEVETHCRLICRYVNSANKRSLYKDESYRLRLEDQDLALMECALLIKTLQKIVGIFNVNINSFKQYSDLITKEEKLITGWRQKDKSRRRQIPGIN